MRIDVTRYEQNRFANAQTCNNGGGYFQPLLLIDATLDGGDWKAIISDTSCGDFGSEVSIDIERGGVVYSCYYGSRAEHEWSNIDYDICGDILDILTKYFGYHPPIKGGWNWGDESKPGTIDFDSEIRGRYLNDDDYDGSYIVDTEYSDGRNDSYFPWTCDPEDDEEDDPEDDPEPDAKPEHECEEVAE